MSCLLKPFYAEGSCLFLLPIWIFFFFSILHQIFPQRRAVQPEMYWDLNYSFESEYFCISYSLFLHMCSEWNSKMSILKTQNWCNKTFLGFLNVLLLMEKDENEILQDFFCGGETFVFRSCNYYYFLHRCNKLYMHYTRLMTWKYLAHNDMEIIN